MSLEESCSSLPMCKGGLQERWGVICSYRTYSYRTKDSSIKLEVSRFRLCIRKKFFTVIV